MQKIKKIIGCILLAFIFPILSGLTSLYMKNNFCLGFSRIACLQLVSVIVALIIMLILKYLINGK